MILLQSLDLQQLPLFGLLLPMWIFCIQIYQKLSLLSFKLLSHFLDLVRAIYIFIKYALDILHQILVSGTAFNFLYLNLCDLVSDLLSLNFMENLLILLPVLHSLFKKDSLSIDLSILSLQLLDFGVKVHFQI